MTERKKYDSFWLGLGLCLIIPFVIFAFTWEKLSGMPFADIKHWLDQPVFLNYLIFLQLPSLIVLFWGYKTERWAVCRGGILGVTPYLMLLFYLFF